MLILPSSGQMMYNPGEIMWQNAHCTLKDVEGLFQCPGLYHIIRDIGLQNLYPGLHRGYVMGFFRVFEPCIPHRGRAFK